MASQWRPLYPPRARRVLPPSPPAFTARPRCPRALSSFHSSSGSPSYSPPPLGRSPPFGNVLYLRSGFSSPLPPSRPSDSSILPSLSFSDSVSLLCPVFPPLPYATFLLLSPAHPRNRPLARPGHANFLRDKSRGSKLDPGDYRLEPPLDSLYRYVVHEVQRARSLGDERPFSLPSALVPPPLPLPCSFRFCITGGRDGSGVHVRPRSPLPLFVSGNFPGKMSKVLERFFLSCIFTRQEHESLRFFTRGRRLMLNARQSKLLEIMVLFCTLFFRFFSQNR